MEKYISLFPPEARSTEDGATPIHPAGNSSATDEKREKLREWVRVQMRAGEMSSEPETLEHKRSVPQKSVSGQWEGPSPKNTRSAGMKGVKTRQDMDVPDDFFEDDTDNEEPLDVEDPTYSPTVELPAKRKPEKTANHPDKHSKPAEKQPTKAKRKKLEKPPPPPVQDSFFGDESE